MSDSAYYDSESERKYFSDTLTDTDQNNDNATSSYLAASTSSASGSSADNEGLPAFQEFQQQLYGPIAYALMQEAGQRLLAWLWSEIEHRYHEDISRFQHGYELARYLSDPHPSLGNKCDRLIAFLDHFPTMSIYMSAARRFKAIVDRIGVPNRSPLEKTLQLLQDFSRLLEEDLAQKLVSQDTRKSMGAWLHSAIEWAAWLQSLSRISLNSPEALVNGLMQKGVLPPWADEMVRQGEALYQEIIQKIDNLKDLSQSSAGQRLHHYLDQFSENKTVPGKLTVLLKLTLDNDIVSMIATHFPTALGGSFKVLALLQDSLPAEMESRSTFRSSLLAVEHFTREAFIGRLENEAGELGQQLGGQLDKARLTLRGSASLEAAMNIMLNLSDPNKSWEDFVFESGQELLLLPEVQGLGVSLASRFSWQINMGQALYQILDETFWAGYNNSSFDALPSLIGNALSRDLQSDDSKLIKAFSALTGWDNGLLSAVLNSVATLFQSWVSGGDWTSFLIRVNAEIEVLLTRYGKSLLPAQAQVAIQVGLGLSNHLAKLMFLRALWSARNGQERLYALATEQLRELLRHSVDDSTLQALDKVLVWLPLLPALVKVLGKLPEMKEGEQIAWIADIFSRLYDDPAVQKHPGIVKLRQQVEIVAQQWLSAMPQAMLSEAKLTELRSRPGLGTKMLIKSMIFAYKSGSSLASSVASGISAMIPSDPQATLNFLTRPVGVAGPVQTLPRMQFNVVAPEEASVPVADPPAEESFNYLPTLVSGGAAIGSFALSMAFVYRGVQSYRERPRYQPVEQVELGKIKDESGRFLDKGPRISTNKLWHPGVYAALATATFAGAAGSAWMAYKTWQETPIEPISKELVEKIEQASGKLGADIDAMSSDTSASSYIFQAATLRVFKDMEELERDLRLIIGPVDAEPVSIAQASVSNTPTPLLLRKVREASNIGIYEQRRNELIADADNARKSIAIFNNSIGKLIQEISKKPDGRLVNGMWPAIGLRPETVAEYNIRQRGNRQKLRETRASLTTEYNKLIKYNSEITALGPLVIEEKFGTLGSTLLSPIESSEITANKPIKEIATAAMLIQHRWQDVAIDNNGLPDGFIEKDVFVRAIDFCNQLIAHFQQERDKKQLDGSYSFKPKEREDFDRDIAKFNEVKETLQGKLEVQVKNTDNIPGLALTGVEGEKEAYLSNRVLEILEFNEDIHDLDLGSYVSVHYQQGENTSSARRRSFTVLDLVKGKHISDSGETVEIEWGDRVDEDTKRALGTLKAEWGQLEKVVARAKEIRALLSDVATLEFKDFTVYANDLLEAAKKTINLSPEESKAVKLDSIVTATRSQNVSEAQRKSQAAHKFLPPMVINYTLLDVMSGKVELERYTRYRSRQTVSFAGSDAASRVAKHIYATRTKVIGGRQVATVDIYKDYLRYVGGNFDNPDVYAKLKQMITIKLRPFLAIGPISAVYLDDEVLPGIISVYSDTGEQIIYSLLDNATWEFSNLDETLESYKNDQYELKTRLEKYLSYITRLKSKDDRILSFRDIDDASQNILEDIRSRYEYDADALTYSADEILWNRVAEFARDTGTILSMLASPFGLASLIIGLATGAGTALAQSFVADLPGEKEAYLREALYSAVFEVLGELPEIAAVFSSKTARMALTSMVADSGPAPRLATKGIDKKLRFFKRSNRRQQIAPVAVPIEPIRTLKNSEAIILTKPQQDIVDALELTFTSDSELISYIQRPRENCFNATLRLKEYLVGSKAQSPIAATLDPQSFTAFKDQASARKLKELVEQQQILVEYRGMGYWRTEKTQMPTNHFVMVVTIGGTRYVIDPTAAQFGYWEFDRAFVDLEENWVRRYQSAIQKKNSNGISKYKDFPTIIGARDMFSPMGQGLPASSYLEGASLITQPIWYNQKPAAARTKFKYAGGTHPEGRIIPHGRERYVIGKSYYKNGNFVHGMRAGTQHQIKVTKVNSKIKIWSVDNDPTPPNLFFVTSHGGFSQTTPSVPVRPGVTHQFLAPHGFQLLDPGISYINTRHGVHPHSTVTDQGAPVAGGSANTFQMHQYTGSYNPGTTPALLPTGPNAPVGTGNPTRVDPATGQLVYDNVGKDLNFLNTGNPGTDFSFLTGAPITQPNHIRNYSLNYYPDIPSNIANQLADNFEMSLANGRYSVDRFHVVQIRDPQINPFSNKSTTDLDEVTGALQEYYRTITGSQTQHPPITVVSSHCRSPGWYDNDPSYRIKGRSGGPLYSANGYIDVHTSNPVSGALTLQSRTPKIFTWKARPAIFARLAAQVLGDTQNVGEEEASNVSDNFSLAGPHRKDLWSKRESWRSGDVFSLLDGLNRLGSLTLHDEYNEHDFIVRRKGILDWELEVPSVVQNGTNGAQAAGARKTVKASNLEELQSAIQNLILPSLNSQKSLKFTLEVEGSNIFWRVRITDEAILSWKGSPTVDTDYAISKNDGAWDRRLFKMDNPTFLTTFGAYLKGIGAEGADNLKAIDALNYLFMHHSLKAQPFWPKEFTRTYIEAKFREISTSTAIANVLASMLLFDGQSLAANEIPFSEKGLSRFMRKLMEQVLSDEGISIDDKHLDRNSMASKFNQHHSQLVDGGLRPDIAAWLVLLNYMDADVDGFVARFESSYDASMRVPVSQGALGAKESLHNQVKIPLSRDLIAGERIRIKIVKGNGKTDYIKVYEIPARYRARDQWLYYIAHVISLDTHPKVDGTYPQLPMFKEKAKVAAGMSLKVKTKGWLNWRDTEYTLIPRSGDPLIILSNLNSRYKVLVEIVE